MAQLHFDASAIPADERSFTPLPAGDYFMQVIDSAMLVPKSGRGEMLKLTIQILDGPFANRLLWDNLNIVHDNEDAQRIANRNLADLCLLLGIVHIDDSEDLHFKPFTARVGIREDKNGQYGPQNTVRYRQTKGPGAPPIPAQAPRQAAPAQQRAAPTQQRAAPAQPQAAPAQQQQPQQQPRNGGPKPWQKPPAARGTKDDKEIPF